MRKVLQGIGILAIAFFIWTILLGIRWEYVVHVMYPGEGLGEPIWVHDPVGFGLITLPFVPIVIVAICMICGDLYPHEGNAS